MSNYKITIRYDGSRYKGWQRLGKNDGDTIQARLEGVIGRLCDEEVAVTASGRTDSGVHALAQVAHFHTKRELNPAEILAYTLRYLPEDIVVTDAVPADERFHARFHVLEKTYIYRLDVGPYPDPFLRKYAWHVPGKLNYRKMREAGAILVGKRDFSSFTNMKSKSKSAVRELRRVEVIEPSTGEDPLAVIRLAADGFLHNMARIISGTLVEVGLGERDPASLTEILTAAKRPDAGTRAPSSGLFLESVIYP